MKRFVILLSVLALQACTTYQGYPAFAAIPTTGGPGALGSGSGVNIITGTVNGTGFTAVVPR
jgi:hypothetical protein